MVEIQFKLIARKNVQNCLWIPIDLCFPCYKNQGLVDHDLTIYDKAVFFSSYC